jgi:hypothetical protein
MTTIEIFSIGSLAGSTQHHPTEIRRAADELGIPPAFVINSVPHFAAQDCERLAEFFRRRAEALP